MHRFDFERWLDDWARAWEARDPDAFPPLLSPNVVWMRDPFAEPIVGADDARGSLAEGLAGVEAITYEWELVSFADPRGVANWRVTLSPRAAPPVRFDGILVADFDEARRCLRLSEWWCRG